MRFGSPLINTIDYGSSYGSTVLKSLQNENYPDLDLLVREAVQNSSDAALQVDGDGVFVDFRTGKFATSALARTLTGVGAYIQARSEPEESYLEIRDTKTQGLTGTYKRQELGQNDHGNYFKLIFDTGKKQMQKDAGGNWGFGKSVYYRVSKFGLVLFYSQIKVPGGYEQRLVASMVEDENKTNSSLLQRIKSNATGRAWWGSPDAPEKEVYPITDRRQIDELLGIFGIESFRPGETGTSIIVPFVDDERLLREARPPADVVDQHVIEKCTWAATVADYIAHACVKWYAPRVNNKRLRKLGDGPKSLIFTVTGDDGKTRRIRAKDMLPFFRLVQDLYTAALCKCLGKNPNDYLGDDSWCEQIQVLPIDLRKSGLSEGRVGYVAFIRISRSELNGNHAGIDPYVLTRNFENSAEVNEPIVMFSRQPGMVIRYAINDAWTKRVEAPARKDGADEYIFGYFVPRVSVRFKHEDSHFDKVKEYVDLGDYLRGCEGSDHVDWQDKSGCRIAAKIQSNCAKKIGEKTSSTESLTLGEGESSPFSNYIGRQMNLTGASRPRPKGKSGGPNSSGGRRRGPAFELGDPVPQGRMLRFAYHLDLRDALSKTLRIEIQTESKTVTSKAWGTDIGTPFPLSIARAESEATSFDGGKLRCKCDAEMPESRCEGVSLAMVHEDGDAEGTFSSLAFSSDLPGQVFDGFLWLQALDRSVEFVIKAV